jgi:hypothetical protein
LPERWRASGNSYSTAAEEADNASQESAAAEEADNTRQESSAAEEADNTRQESSAAEEADYEIVENSAAANLARDIDCLVAECTGSLKRKRRALGTPSPQSTTWSSVKAMLMRQYRMKDLGPVRQFLGLEISRNGQHTITLGQQAYIDTILQRFEMTTAYGVQTALDPNVRLDGHGQQGGVEVDPTQYQAIVGSLMYAALGTRPDIAYAVAAFSRYNSRPLTVHLTAAKQVLRYLKTTKTAKLYYSTNGVTELHGYTDADWAGDSVDRKSQGGYTFIMGGAAASWQSRKQPLIALSTLETEYIACSDAVRETKWVLQLAKDVDFHTTAEKTNAEKMTAAERTTVAEKTTAYQYLDSSGSGEGIYTRKQTLKQTLPRAK